MAIPRLSHGYPTGGWESAEKVDFEWSMHLDGARLVSAYKGGSNGWQGAKKHGRCNKKRDKGILLRYSCACSYLLGTLN